MTEPPRLVLSYLGEDVYHRSSVDDDLRPACRPSRIRGVPTMRVRADRQGQRACPLCWPSVPGADQTPNGR